MSLFVSTFKINYKMKKIFLLLSIAVFSCSDKEPELSEQFTGQYSARSSTTTQTNTYQWVITKAGEDRVNIDIDNRIDFVDTRKMDQGEIYSVPSVLVEAGGGMIFQNPVYLPDGSNISISGSASLSGHFLKLNLVMFDNAGYKSIIKYDLVKH